ncbi:hypothetical protein LCGC14_1760240 [marine sediment metagenome]|uniref:Uncharacterized protein n=1 Tax=marine sediment metagenome TaxID=412755 RepID=A0A0F9K0Y0_9ZZZZ
MPPKPSRSQQQHRRNLRQSVRIATSSIRRAVSQASPAQRRQLQKEGFSPRAVIVTEKRHIAVPEAVAWASSPITFRASSATGKLVTTRVRSVGQHEVAHILGAGHPAIAATRTDATSTGIGMRQAPLAEKKSASFRLQRRVRRAVSVEARKTDKSIQGFNTPQLTKVIRGGTPAQQKRARMLARKLGRRVKSKKRGIDF